MAITTSDDATFIADDKWTVIWRAMLRLVKEKKSIDSSLVRSVVLSEGYMSASQVEATLDELLMASESALHMDDWVSEQFTYYQRRELLDIAGRVEAELDRGKSGPEIIDELTKKISLLTGLKERITIEESATAVQKQLLDYAKRGVLRRGLQTPFPRLNRFTNGFGKNWLIIIGADSGIGKTTMGLQFIDNVLENDQGRAMVITLEMTPDDLTERLISGRTMIDGDKIKRADLTPAEAEEVRVATDIMKGYGDRMVMITSESFKGLPTAEKLSAAIRVEHARSPLAVILIDYFQLFAIGNVDEKENACRVINMTAKQLGVPVILLSQLSRGYIADNRPPEPRDLRGTSQLQNDPDLIILLDNKSRRIPKERWAMDGIIEDQVDAYIAKFRHGAMGDFPLHFDGAHYLFIEPKGTVVMGGDHALPPKSHQTPSDYLLGN